MAFESPWLLLEPVDVDAGSKLTEQVLSKDTNKHGLALSLAAVTRLWQAKPWKDDYKVIMYLR